MNNFHFVDIKPTIDRKETTSIKDAIFKRAREKAQAMTEEKSENYTAQVQNDVMEIARESLKPSPMNPFNQFMDNIGVQNGQPAASETANKTAEIKNEIEKIEEVYTREVKRNIESVSNQAFANSVKDETMTAARNQFRTNLNTTLNFLNTQAAIKAAENAHSKINYII